MSAYSQWVKGRIETGIAGRTWKAALLKPTYVLDIDTHTYWNQVEAQQVAGSGYVSGGVVIPLTTTYDAAANKILIKTTTIATNFGIVNGDVAAMCVYNWTGSAGSSPLLMIDKFAPMTINNTEFTYTFPTEGLVAISIL